MPKNDATVAVLADHTAAEAAIRKLADGGLPIEHFSIIGKGYHTEEKVIGFYNTGDSIKFWGGNGAIWGGLWGLFLGGLFVTVPMVGPVMVLGHFAGMVYAALEGAVVVGGLSALGAALFSLGIPKDSIIQYEEALKADRFLIVAHGPADEIARAKAILATMSPLKLDHHHDVNDIAPMPSDTSVNSAAV